MTYRERFTAMLHHRPVDRPPYDLDGTPMSLILDEKLRLEIAKLLGIRTEDPTEGILKALDIDFRRIGHMPHATSPLERTISPTHNVDIWGIERRLSGNDWQISSSPLKDASIEDLDRFPWPQVSTVDKREISLIRDRAKRLFEETDYVVSGEHPVFGVMELGCWMCGFDDFLCRLAAEPEFVEAFCARVWEYQRDMIDLYYGAIGPYLHLTTSGDDFGTQTGPFLSPGMFDELIAPWYDKRIALTKQYTSAAFFHHSCGSVFRLIPRLLRSGVEILNPIQPGAREMEPERLRTEFGDRICFWGGIDTQHILPEGSEEDVIRHVRDLRRTFDPSRGGWVLAPAHCLQRDVPARNVIAMYRGDDASLPRTE